ncbi:MAG: pantoate--beta-alanine ligase, partial [Streptomycetales bacterium]
PLTLDYLALADPETFLEVPAGHSGPALLLVAARVGGTRLIDNVPVQLRGGGMP